MFIWRIAKWLGRRIIGRVVPGLRGKSLSSVVTSLIGQNGTQLNGLLEKFNKGGLASLAQSWVSKGKNLPLSGEQAKSVLGADTIKQIAAQLGKSDDVAASKVAGALPQLVNKLTPQGQVPDQETLAKTLAKLLKS